MESTAPVLMHSGRYLVVKIAVFAFNTVPPCKVSLSLWGDGVCGVQFTAPLVQDTIARRPKRALT